MSSEQELFSVNEGYKIGLHFFLRLGPLLETKAKDLEGDLVVHDLFFCEVCSGFEASAEWIEAVFRVNHAYRQELKLLQLTETELFACVIEFCKIYNERWENVLAYILSQLESMQTNPEQHSLEWDIWKKAKEHAIAYPESFDDVDWSAELP